MKEDKTLHGMQPHTDPDATMECTNPATQRIPLSPQGEEATMHVPDTQIQPHTPHSQPVNNTAEEIANPNGAIFVLGGKIYREIRTLSKSSGEAQVMLVEREGEKAVLKLYYPGYTPEEGVQQVVWNMNFEMIVRLYDYGKTIVEGIVREYELMEWLEGCSLADYNLKEDLDTFKRLALTTAAAVEYCHNCNLIHKDVKLGNFIFRDKERKELVLTDFGISTLRSDDEQLHKTTQARTPLYAAPEMYDNVIDGEVELTPAADYYSLGIVLFFLWLGKNPFSGNERAMMRLKSEGKLPNLDKLPEEVRLLVRGLTLVNPEKRWGYDEVERWYKGEKVEVDETSIYLKYKSFVVDSEKNILASNAQELAALLSVRRHLGVKYLYSKVISAWLEECGNQKMAVELDDIVDKRYPLLPEVGFQAALYTLDRKMPYRDSKGHEAGNVHEVVMILLANMEDYKLLLQDEHHPLFVYLEMTTELEVSRLKGYFKTDSPDIALWRMIYEIDDSIPFLLDKPSATTDEIIAAFASSNPREDEWRALTDGRLLSWIYYKCDPTIYVELKEIYDEHRPYTRSEAYRVLYHLNHHIGFDLGEATERMTVAALMANDMVKLQRCNIQDFCRQMEEYIGPNSRLMYYAQIRGWRDVIALHRHAFDMNSTEHTSRYGVYNERIAAYRLCAAMGYTPEYYVKTGGEIIDSLEGCRNQSITSRKEEMTDGCMKQWLAIFFHEDPTKQFASPLSYEKALVSYIEEIGKTDSEDPYFKRMKQAQKSGKKKQATVRLTGASIRKREKALTASFLTLTGILGLLIAFFGYSNPLLFLQNSPFCVALPIGLMTMMILAVWSYFHGNGVLTSLLCAVGGACTGWIPVLILRFIGADNPSLLTIASLIILAGYAALAIFTSRTKSIYKYHGLEELFKDNKEAALLDVLHYTFRQKTQQFKGSNHKAQEDAIGVMKATQVEYIIHYALWICFMLIPIVLMISYHSSLLDLPLPDLNGIKEFLHGFWESLKNPID